MECVGTYHQSLWHRFPFSTTLPFHSIDQTFRCFIRVSRLVAISFIQLRALYELRRVKGFLGGLLPENIIQTDHKSQVLLIF